MPTVDAAAASAREPMDREAMHREQQRQITAAMPEDLKRRDASVANIWKTPSPPCNPSPRRATARPPNGTPRLKQWGRPLASMPTTRP